MAVERIGLEDIRAGYKMYKDARYYGLFDTNGRSAVNNVLFTYKGEDLEKDGWHQLEENLQAAQQSAPDMPFIIRFYDQLGKREGIDKSTPSIGCFQMRMNKYEGYKPAVVGAGGGGMDMINQLFQAKLDLLQQTYDSKIEQMEREHEDELDELEKEADKRSSGKLGAIGQIGEALQQYPVLADLAKPLVESLKDMLTLGRHKLRSHTQHHAPADGGIAGVDTAEAPAAEHQAAATGTYRESIDRSLHKMFTWYAKQEGPIDDKEARQRGADKMAADMAMLADLTEDTDMMLLALKKLRAIG